MSKKHCMFQYATSYRWLNAKIYEDTDLITWDEAVALWNKYKPQFIEELEDGDSNPEMIIWTGCEDNNSYSNDTFHIDKNTIVEDGDFIEKITKVIDPNKVSMGEPITGKDKS